MAEEDLKSKTKKGLYWKAFDTYASFAMQFIVGIVMARLLTPEDYGITALPAVFMAIASTIVDGRFGLALIRKPKLTQQDLSTAFIYSLLMGLSMFICLYFCAPLISEFYNTPILTPLVRVTALTFIWGPLTTPQIVILRRKLDFKTPARISFIKNILSGVAGIAAAYVGYGVWALVIASITSSLLEVTLLWIAVKWYPHAKFSRDSFKYLWGYGNRLMGVDLMNTIQINIAPVIIGKYFSPTELGLYNRAQSFSILPISQLNTTISSVTFPVLSKINDDREKQTIYYRKMIRTACFISFLIMMLLAGLAKPIVILLLTEKWADCILLLQILCFATMWGPMSSLNLNILQVSGRTDLYFNLEIKKKIIALFLMFISLPFGVTWFCLSLVVNQFVCIYINVKSANKVLPLSLREQFKDVLPSFILSLLTFLISFGVTFLVDNYWLQILFGGIIGTVVYLGFAFVLKFEGLENAIYLLKRF